MPGTTLPSDCMGCEATFQTAVALPTETNMLGSMSRSCLTTILSCITPNSCVPSLHRYSVRAVRAAVKSHSAHDPIPGISTARGARLPQNDPEPQRTQRPTEGYCSDFGSDLFTGDFLSSRATSSRALAGTPTLPPRMISFAVSFLP